MSKAGKDRGRGDGAGKSGICDQNAERQHKCHQGGIFSADLLSLIKAKATVYYELVQLKENGASSDTWGVLASVGTIYIDKDSMPQDWNRDYGFQWGYSFNCFTATGHTSTLEKPGGPAIKMSRTTVPEGENPQITTENSVFTAPVENLRTKPFPRGIPVGAIRTAFTSPKSIRMATLGQILCGTVRLL